MLLSDGDKGRFILRHQIAVLAIGHLGSSAHHDPVLSPVMVELAGETGAGFDGDELDLVAVAGVDGIKVAPRAVDLPVPNVLAAVDTRWAQSKGHPHGDLSTSVLASTQPFAPRLLAPKVLVQAAALGFVRVDAQVNRLVADRKESGNLFRAPVVSSPIK